MSQNPPPPWGPPRDADLDRGDFQPPPDTPYGGYYQDDRSLPWSGYQPPSPGYPPTGAPPTGYQPGTAYQPPGPGRQPSAGSGPYGGYQPYAGANQPYPGANQPYGSQPYPGYVPYGGYRGQFGPLAGWWSRVGATVIDGLLVAVPLCILWAVVPLSSGPDVAVALLVWVAAAVYYIASIATAGQTLGNRAVGTRVVDVRTGGLPGWGKAAGLYFMWLLMGVGSLFFGLSALMDVLWPLWDDRRQTLHDKAAGTIVVRTRLS